MTLLSMQIDEAQAASMRLMGIPHATERLIALITAAETLSEISTGVTAAVASIASGCRSSASAIDRARAELTGFELPLRTGADRRLDRFRIGPADPALFEPFVAEGGWEFSAGTSRRERWLDVTRLSNDDRAAAEAWGHRVGLDPDAALLAIGRYRTLDDRTIAETIAENEELSGAADPTRTVNDILVSGSMPDLLSDITAQRTIIETDARRLFMYIELSGARNGWDDAQMAKAREAALAHLGASDQRLGWPNSDENNRQLEIAFATLMAKAELGEPLPTLTRAEVDSALAGGATEETYNEFNREVLSVTAPFAHMSGNRVVRTGVPALATAADAAALLSAVANGDAQTVREVTADLGAATSVSLILRLIPKLPGAPIKLMTGLILALTSVGRPQPDSRPAPGPPRTGYIDEQGRSVQNVKCGNAAGIPEKHLCD